MPAQLILLGLPQVKTDQDCQALRLNNSALLLIYLAVKGDWISRSELAFLFRPDVGEGAALKQVRLLLYRAKQLAWTYNLEIQRESVRFHISSDIQSFRKAVRQQNWAEACKQYKAPFLASYSSPNLPTYNAWLELERADLASSYKDALTRYSSALETQGSYEDAANVIAALMKLDPLDEDNLRNYLRTTYLAGHREKALELYDKFCRELALEYKALPLEVTQQLANDIRHHRNISPKGLSQQSISVPTKNNLPAQSTHFIGRKNELATLAQQLHDPMCRLLSIIGLGGIGKTRLAIALAEQQAANFKDGVCYVALENLTKAETLDRHLAQALNFTVGPNQTTKEQLEHYLKGKDLLLILDNFEHLLEAAPFVAELLNINPAIKIVVTSRQRLGLKSEWLYDLEGLSFPLEDGSLEQNNDAIILFLNSAKRVAPKLDFSQDDLKRIAGICRQLEGLPLAIELAANWTRVMPVAHISQELIRTLDLLETDAKDLPLRQQSMRRILDATWQNLHRASQHVLTKLSVFDSFSFAAAQTLTNTSYSLLLSLMNQSLLKTSQRERFSMHSLIKQYSREKLKSDPQKEHDAFADQFSFFCELLNKGLEKRKGEKGQQWLLQVQQDESNILNSLYWGIENAPEQAVKLSIDFASIWITTLIKFAIAVEALELVNPQLKRVSEDLQSQYYYYLALGQKRHLSKAHSLGKKALALAQKVAQLELQTGPFFLLGSIDLSRARYNEALQWFNSAIETCQKSGNSYDHAIIYFYKAQVFFAKGDYLKSLDIHEEGLQLSKSAGETVSFVDKLVSMALCYLYIGKLQKAKQFFADAEQRAKEIKYESKLNELTIHKGQVALAEGKPGLAQNYMVKGLQAYLELSIDKAYALYYCAKNLAEVWHQLGHSFHSSTLLAFAELYAETSGHVPYNSQNPSRLIEELKAHLGEAAFQKAWSQGRELSFDQVQKLIQIY